MVRKELLDELDRRILSELQRNARASNRAVARAVGVSPPTVAQRIRRMENVGLIRGYRVDVAMSEVRAPNVEPGIKCAECRGPIHGPPRMRRFNERSFAFCCPMCEGTFED
ncbi:MAG: Lrp/AsnC family transcriptional regulator, partial [bacterium]